MLLEIITPDRKIFEGEVNSVMVPGTNGTFQMLNNHAAIISTLVNGPVKVRTNGGEEVFDVKGGVVEMLSNKVIILAESA